MPFPRSIFSNDVEKGRSSIQGFGLFARRSLPQGTIVVVKGGHVFDKATRDRVFQTLGPAEIQIADDLFLGPSTVEEREASMMYLNHSCDPNVGVRGQILFVTMRDVGESEELTVDYAMIDNEEYEMTCHCGAKACRGVVTGFGWRKPELQRRYEGFFSSYLEDKIRQLR
jgi:SET domain-containing protein